MPFMCTCVYVHAINEFDIGSDPGFGVVLYVFAVCC